jgi:hypothetical protein
MVIIIMITVNITAIAVTQDSNFGTRDRVVVIMGGTGFVSISTAGYMNVPRIIVA